MDFILSFLALFWELTLSIGLYVLIGLVFVGVVHLYISEAWIQKHLGKEGASSALKAALYGIPLPLCSCGVIPLAASLRQKGASKGAVTSFFITTPMTGIDSLIATYGVFGLPMALIRLIASFISGVIAGMWVGLVPDKTSTFKTTPKEGECCAQQGCCSKTTPAPKSAFKRAYEYALFEVFADLAKPMFFGLVLATLLVLLIPERGMEMIRDYPLLSYFAVLLLALPMYVCSISAIPLALGLLSVGATPGMAFLFLAAAPATNVITVGIIRSILGVRVMVIYLVSITLITLLTAFLIDLVLPLSWFNIGVMEGHESHGLLAWVSGVVFLGMVGYFMGRSFKST